MSEGYYRFPTIAGERIVFTCEDDLWTVPLSGGVARRLTSNLGRVGRSCLSPDGSLLAFTGQEEGPTDVYCMPADGGPARRITHLGAFTEVVGWTPDGNEVVFWSNARQPLFRVRALFTVPADGGFGPKAMNLGPATGISFGPDGALAIHRHATDPARWKRYHGGTAGDLWIDENGNGEFRRLLDLTSNQVNPMWIGDRVYF